MSSMKMRPRLLSHIANVLAPAPPNSNEYSYYDIEENNGPNKGDYILAITSGTIGMFFSLLVILANFQVVVISVWLAPGGLVELCLAILMLALFVTSVIILTRSDGIASNAGNVYYSVWVSAFCCVWIIAKWRRR